MADDPIAASSTADDGRPPQSDVSDLGSEDRRHILHPLALSCSNVLVAGAHRSHRGKVGLKGVLQP
jgi:hypothetical protein